MRTSWPELMESLRDCERCGLCRGRTNIVPGEGNPFAELMFVGEGPGQEEDRQGRPFVGPSGELLTKMIHAIGMERSECYIANIVKCRPPGNRNPSPEEAEACIGFLRQQTALIRPKVIVLLGRVACRYILKEEIFITRDHGVWFERKGTWFMPTFHPISATNSTLGPGAACAIATDALNCGSVSQWRSSTRSSPLHFEAMNSTRSAPLTMA